MKIAAWIPLIREINNSVDFLNLIPNAEEHNIEFAEDQYVNTMGSTRIRSWWIGCLTSNLRNLSSILKIHVKNFSWVTLQIKFQA